MAKSCFGCKYYVRSKDFLFKYRIGYGYYVCANKGSDYYGAYLNIDEDGNYSEDVWPGCDKRKRKKVVV